MYYYLCSAFQAHHTSPSTSIFHTVAHLPLLAPEPLLNLDHHRGADPCAISLNALVLTTGAAALHFHTMSVSYARNSHFLHISLIFQFYL
jgi:hypothetical protein